MRPRRAPEFATSTFGGSTFAGEVAIAIGQLPHPDRRNNPRKESSHRPREMASMIGLVRELSTPGSDRSLQWDAKLARKQHAQFIEALTELGVRITWLPAIPDKPEALPVEGAAVLLPELAVIARQPSDLRQTIIDAIAAKLRTYRPTVRIFSPALLDAADVFRAGNTLYVGMSDGTNAEGVAALTEIVEPLGYTLRTIEYRERPTLTAACTFVPPCFVVLNPAWVDAKNFDDLVTIATDETEPQAADTLTIGGTTLVSSAFPKTAERLRAAAVATRKVDISEFHRLNVGLSGLALLIEPRVVRSAAAPVNTRIVRSSDAPLTLFAPAVVHDGLVFVSGQLPIDPKTGQVVAGDVEAQTEQMLSNLAAVVEAAGSVAGRILRLTLYLTDVKNAERVMEICARVLNGYRPAGNIVAVRALQQGCAVAADAIAAVAST